ncbi:MAG: heme-binding domain-containing protein [Arcobacteraceae bacterium]
MKNTLIIIFAIFVLMQAIQVEYSNPQTDANLEMKMPENIHQIFKKSCYDCHSNEVILPWYSNIAPVSWMVSKHIDNGRQTLNFSIWETYTPEEKEKKLKEVFRTVYAAMPLPAYMWMHEEAQLSKEERATVREWIGYSK